MTPAALDPPARRVLRALYELAQLDCPAHAGVLARAINFSLALPSAHLATGARAKSPGARFPMRAIDVGRVLLVLDARGLASAEHARLTLAGLLVAARCEPLQLESAPWLARRLARSLPTRVVGLRAARVAGARDA